MQSMTGHNATPIQLTQRTSRPASRLLDDLVMLDVPGAWVTERGSTYLVFSPREKERYTTGRAATLTVIAVFAILILTAVSALFIALLPLAALPLAPLLFHDQPLLAVGAMKDDAGVTRVTVHGQAWGDLAVVLDAYLAHLPQPPEGAEDAPPAGRREPVAVGAAGGWPGSQDLDGS
jgi:hypothetical protein